MPLGLNRLGSFSNGSPVTPPIDFGTDVVLPKSFGNAVVTPLDVGNPVTWTPDPAHFGNVIVPSVVDGLLEEDGVNFFELENNLGVILLEI